LANRGGHPCLAHEVPSYRKLRSPERHRANICACFIHTDISDKIDQPDRLAQATPNLEACEVSGHAFLVSYQGSVYDLRPNIASVAAAMTAFNPDKTWRGVTDATQSPTAAK
jgi:hypothetical protein